MVLREAALPFDGGKAESRSPFHRGGKGMGLTIMTEQGFPVPPGFTISLGTHKAYMQHKRLPKRLHEQIKRQIRRLEKQTGKTFGGSDNPLLVSVRSGAKVSMPGMMDTILNVGLTSEVLETIVTKHGESFAGKLLDSLAGLWPSTYRLSDNDPFDQLVKAIEAVYASWNSERAIAYRKEHDISSREGTAVTIQAMVFGNLDQQSCTGVVFSANPSTGQEKFFGEFLPMAQGEDLVGGTRTPNQIADFASWNSVLDKELRTHVDRLVDHFDMPVDVEFTVESGKLFILQVRRLQLSSIAEAVFRVHRVWAREMTKQEAVADAPDLNIPLGGFTMTDRMEAQSAGRLLATGTPVSPGAVVGRIAYSVQEAKRLAQAGHSVIFARHDTSPNDLPGMQIAKAIVTQRGGTTCHAAIVARELRIPAVVGVDIAALVAEGTLISVDGENGDVYVGELPPVRSDPPKEVNIFQKWVRQLDYKYVAFDLHNHELSANQFLIDCYLLSMLHAIAPNDPNVKILHDKTYRHVAGVFALYLLMATSGEARHVDRYNKDRVSSAVEFVERTLNLSLRGHLQRDDIHSRTVAVTKGFSAEQLAVYVSHLYDIFRNGGWQGSGYGGQAWAKIAETLLLYLRGEISSVIFVDAVFDLRHNGNCLFNKNSLFSGYTDEVYLRSMLDAKKEVNNPSALFRRLTEYSDKPSATVLALWRRYVKY